MFQAVVRSSVFVTLFFHEALKDGSIRAAATKTVRQLCGDSVLSKFLYRMQFAFIKTTTVCNGFLNETPAVSRGKG